MSARTSSVSPCSGSASVVVRDDAPSPRFSAIPSAMVVCMPLRVDRGDMRLDLLVDVLPPDQDPDRTGGSVGCGHGDSAFWLGVCGFE